MPDPYSHIATAEPAVVKVLIDAMELRAADPQQRVIRERFLSEVALGEDARVLEARLRVGCDLPGAREEAADRRGGRARPFDDEEFDAVVSHTCLTHVPGPEKALRVQPHRSGASAQLRNPHPRAVAVCEALRPAWAQRPAGGDGRGAGVAFQQYEIENAYAGTYVEVTVDESTGAIRVTRAVVAHDCRLIAKGKWAEGQAPRGSQAAGCGRGTSNRVILARSVCSTSEYADGSSAYAGLA